MKKKLLSTVVAFALVLGLQFPVSAFGNEGSNQQSSSVNSSSINLQDGTSDVQWTSADFTYTENYSKRLYGCDYSRDFAITGKVVSGFSDSGLEKFKTSKKITIPSVDDTGETIVGVGEKAFYEKGITGVTFPSGMMVDYDDTLTHRVTKRGNFVIAESAFAKNEIENVTLPEGVIAVLPNAFQMNKITNVKFPKTIWWIENLAFASNLISKVVFPTTCDFQLEMHGLTFGNNLIKSVRLPDFTEVVNKTVFAFNLGVEKVSSSLSANQKTYKTVDGISRDTGIVNMYTDNAELEVKERIHHIDRTISSQKSDYQRLVVNDGTDSTQNPDLPWNISDFTLSKTADGTGAVVTGFSESGKEKVKTDSDIIIPDVDRDGLYIRELADAQAGKNGLFGAEGLSISSVYLPSSLRKIGNFVFQNSGLGDVTFPYSLEEIGNAAFQTNNLTSVILPDSVKKIGTGCFGTNKNISKINLSKSLTDIPGGAFGCSDAKNYMSNLTEISLHEGIKTIGDNAFAGNNFHDIKTPSTLVSIGRYAFSTKEYLTDACTLTLNEGLTTIGDNAFRNKTIASVELPSTVTALKKNTFMKQYSDGSTPVNTQVKVASRAQYEDKTNFPASDYHTLIYTKADIWTAEDFTYTDQGFCMWPAGEYQTTLNFNEHVVSGLSDYGKEKIKENTELVIPSVDSDGKKVQGIGDGAFNSRTTGVKLTSVEIPSNVTAAWDQSTWSTTGKEVTTRGDFFIGANAFLNNSFDRIDLPYGVIYVGANAFKGCGIKSVAIPTSAMVIGNAAFGANSITSLDLPEKTDFAFNVDRQAFAVNKIKSVRIPKNTEKLDKWAFMQCTGMEQVTASGASAAEKKGGVVHMYVESTSELGSYVAYIDGSTSSNIQKLVVGSLPEDQKPWGENDFTFSATGETVLGLSDSGKAKLKNNPNVVLPTKGTGDVNITAIGDGQSLTGVFTVVDDGGTADDKTDDKNYTPESIVLPNTLTTIGSFAFALDGTKTYESEMNAIKLPSSLQAIGATAFQNNKLTSLDIPDSVTTIGTAAFTGWTKLARVKLSSGCTQIPDAMLASANTTESKITAIEIPEGVTAIGKRSFIGSGAGEIKLSSTLTSIGDSAFQNHALTSLDVPASVTTIGKYAFRISVEDSTSRLSKLTLHEGLVTIGQEAFTGNAITEVDLPSTVILSHVNKAADCIFGNARAKCDPPVKFKTNVASKVDEFNTEFANANSHVVVYDKLTWSGWNADDFSYDTASGQLNGWTDQGKEKHKTLRTLVLPDKTPGDDGVDIIKIGDGAFNLEDESTPTKFGYDSPYGAQSINLPKNVKSIGNKAFAFNSLKEVNLSSITQIGEEAFKGNLLESVSMPDTVINLGAGAFSANNITSLRISNALTTIPQGAFSMNIRLSQIEIPNTITEIGETAFAGARLTSLEIPSSVQKIGKKAFHLHHLTSLTIPGNVRTIEESAFEGTYKDATLKTLTLGEGIETIGDRAFKEALIERAKLPTSLKSLGVNVFENNKGKDGKGVVELTTTNPAHKKFVDSTYTVVLIGEKKSHTVSVVKKGTGSVSVNGSSKTSVSIESDNVATLKWASNKTKTNINVIKSLKVNGKQVYSRSKLKTSAWKTANSEYKRRMKQNVKQTTFDTVVKSLSTSSSYNLGKITSDVKVEIEFEELVPVYRLYNMITSEHLFTTDKTEYDNWVAVGKKNKDFWIGEGIAWLAPKTGKNVYRLYNSGLGALGKSSHYYTSDEKEIKSLTTKYGWKKETQFSGGFVFKSGGSGAIFTCYNEALGSAHHYTASKSEWQGLKKHGWDLESKKNGTSGFFQCVLSTM